MAAEAVDAQNLALQATQAQDDVQALRTGLANFSGELERIPSLFRSMVEKELRQSTSLSIAEWSDVLADLAGRLARLRAAAEQLAHGSTPRGGDAARPAEFPALVADLQALHGFLAKIPGRLSMVPSLLLGPRERAEFLGNIADQTRHLEALTIALPRLAAGAAQLALP
jgi:hypothetical protein